MGPGKTTSHDPFPGQQFDVNSVGQQEPKGSLYVNVPLNVFFLLTPLKGLSLQGNVNTQAIQLKHLSTGLRKCTGLAGICPFPSSLHGNGIHFVGLAVNSANAALLSPCFDFATVCHPPQRLGEGSFPGRCMNKIIHKNRASRKLIKENLKVDQ